MSSTWLCFLCRCLMTQTVICSIFVHIFYLVGTKTGMSCYELIYFSCKKFHQFISTFNCAETQTWQRHFWKKRKEKKSHNGRLPNTCAFYIGKITFTLWKKNCHLRKSAASSAAVQVLVFHCKVAIVYERQQQPELDSTNKCVKLQ